MNRARLLLSAVLATAWLGAASAALAACPYQFMTDGTVFTTASSPSYYMVPQGNAYWTAVAIRAQSPADDWDIEAWAGIAPEPTCISGGLANSTQGPGLVDFVVGDFNHVSAGVFYSRVIQQSGTGGAYVQWDDGTDKVVPDAGMIDPYMGANDLVRVYDVYLTAGVPYTFHMLRRAGVARRLALFRNTSGGAYWTGRAHAVLDIGACAQYTAPSTGYYGLVLINDAGEAGYCQIGVSSSGCECPTTLFPDVPMNVTGATIAHLALEQESFTWFGFAARPISGDWDVRLYGSASGSAAPVCAGDLKGSSSYGGSTVDFVAGDFSNFGSAPLGWYFPYLTQFSGTGGVTAEHVTWRGTLEVNDDYAQVPVFATDLAKVYDAYLVAGHTYTLEYLGTAGHTLLLFAPSASGASFTGRGGAALSTTAAATTFTATVSGYHGVVIANDGAVAGSDFVAIGDCGLVTPLASTVAVTTPDADHAYYSFNQVSYYWTAVGVRAPGGSWDLAVNGNTVPAPAPACTTTPLATSTLSLPRMDFVVGDFNFAATGTFQAHAHRMGGGGTAQVQWDGGSDLILVNDAVATTRVTGASDLLGCWDVNLQAGQAYDFTLTHGGGADLHLMLFRNAAGGAYWAGRSSAEFDVTSTRTFVAPATGYYGVVVANDNGVADTYAIRVANCALTQDVPPATVTPVAAPAAFLRYTPTNIYWCPFAVRASGATDDWDLQAFSNPSGGAAGTCFSDALAASTYGTAYTDFVIADFNFTPLATYYARPWAYSGTGGAVVQWRDTQQTLTVGGASAHRVVSGPFLVESWDAPLQAGHTYGVAFTHYADLNARVCVFAPTGGAYWAPRASALVQSNHSVNFTATTTGYYGIVVVNDGGTGWFDVALTATAVDADANTPPDRDALLAVVPNPGRGPVRIDYATRGDAAATFDLLDMAGRVVARLQPGGRGAGRWSQHWDARDAKGTAVPAGLYLVRMSIGARVIGSRKLVLLP